MITADLKESNEESNEESNDKSNEELDESHGSIKATDHSASDLSKKEVTRDTFPGRSEVLRDRL